MSKKIDVQQAVMAADMSYAEKIRKMLSEKGILMVNLIGSPGSGKTTLLEETFKNAKFRAAVIEGDIATERDAARIRATGVPAVQINTHGGCHLEANWVESKLAEFSLDEIDILFVENVGNLVCPAEFDIGEDYKVAISSTPEGADKPLKYPLLFSQAGAVVLTKIDLIPYVHFDEDLYWKDVYKLNPETKRVKMASMQGQGMEEWFKILDGWLKEKRGE